MREPYPAHQEQTQVDAFLPDHTKEFKKHEKPLIWIWELKWTRHFWTAIEKKCVWIAEAEILPWYQISSGLAKERLLLADTSIYWKRVILCWHVRFFSASTESQIWPRGASHTRRPWPGAARSAAAVLYDKNTALSNNKEHDQAPWDISSHLSTKSTLLVL